MMALRVSIVFVLLLFSACTTNVALVDRNFGHEQIISQRALRLRTQRTSIQEADEHGVFRFFLAFEAFNETAEPWEVKAADFGVKLMPCGDRVCTRATIEVAPGIETVVTVPAAGSTRFELPFRIHRTTEGERNRLTDLEPFPIELRVRAPGRDERHLLLCKRLALGSYSQVGQAARMFALFTLALLFV